MAGICLCQFKECEKANNCRRYLESLKANEYNSYAEFKNICNEDNNYQWFWKVENEVTRTKNNEDQTT